MLRQSSRRALCVDGRYYDEEFYLLRLDNVTHAGSAKTVTGSRTRAQRADIPWNLANFPTRRGHGWLPADMSR